MSNIDYLIKDPFPSIPPALLNSADIEDYVRVTGMIDPFYLATLKPASYEADFLGEVYHWKDNKTALTIEKIEKGQKFTIRKNSIVFIHLETVFCLPSYIALRFNLRITLVHRGLLLGTGPLVDPGFHGRLLIPLHNLTSEDCVLEGGQGLIWIEFTKLSSNEQWGAQCNRAGDLDVRKGVYKYFPAGKNDVSAQKYLAQASPHAPIASSIPHLLDEARRTSQESSNLLRQIRRYGILGAATTLAALALSLGAMFYQVFGLVSNANSYVNALRKDMDVTERRLDLQNGSMRQLDEKVKALEHEIGALKSKPNQNVTNTTISASGKRPQTKGP